MGKLYCEMIFTTAAPTGEVAAWLQSNCQGQWDLLPVGLGGDGETTKFLILFDNPTDRVVFTTRFTPAA
jgi:hypothetical protein